MNRLLNAVMNDPLVPGLRNSLNTFVSTEDVGCAFVYAIENMQALIPREPNELSDIVFNLGVDDPFSDGELAAHLQHRILGELRKPILELPIDVILLFAAFSTYGAKLLNAFGPEAEREPALPYDLARLFGGPHYQDPAKVNSVFRANGFALKHDTPQKAIDSSVVFKFLTDWADKPKMDATRALIRNFLEHRKRSNYPYSWLRIE